MCNTAVASCNTAVAACRVLSEPRHERPTSRGGSSRLVHDPNRDSDPAQLWALAVVDGPMRRALRKAVSVLPVSPTEEERFVRMTEDQSCDTADRQDVTITIRCTAAGRAGRRSRADRPRRLSGLCRGCVPVQPLLIRQHAVCHPQVGWRPSRSRQTARPLSQIAAVTSLGARGDGASMDRCRGAPPPSSCCHRTVRSSKRCTPLRPRAVLPGDHAAS